MHIADPLFKYSSGKALWGDSVTQACWKLKRAMVSAPVLKHPDFNKQFVIFSDASATGGGAVLSQEHDGIYFPVAYASWIFSDAERNYSTTEREMLALVKATKKWKSFFLEKKFHAMTDHKALTGYGSAPILSVVMHTLRY